MKHELVCDHCHNPSVLLDSWAVMDTKTGDMVLHSTFGSAFCQDCDGEIGHAYTYHHPEPPAPHG